MKRTPDQITIRKHERRIAKLEMENERLRTAKDANLSTLRQISSEIGKARSVIILTDPDHQKLLTHIELIGNMAATAVAVGRKRATKPVGK